MSPAESEAMALVRQADPDRYLSALYAPPERRGALFALYAFNAEVAAVRDRVSEPLPGEVRLQWWRDAIAAGDPVAAGGHPLATALLEAVRTHDLPRAAFLNMLEARTFDLYDDPMPSRTDLEGYCGETAGALIQLAALVLDTPAAARTGALAGHAGCAQAVAGLLRLLPIHRRRGQCYIPRGVLQAAGLTPGDLLAGKDRQGAARAVAAMVALGREHLSAFERDAAGLPATLRPAYLPLALVGAYLDRSEHQGAAALEETLSLSPLARHWRLLRRALSGW